MQIDEAQHGSPLSVDYAGQRLIPDDEEWRTSSDTPSRRATLQELGDADLPAVLVPKLPLPDSDHGSAHGDKETAPALGQPGDEAPLTPQLGTERPSHDDHMTDSPASDGRLEMEEEETAPSTTQAAPERERETASPKTPTQ